MDFAHVTMSARLFSGLTTSTRLRDGRAVSIRLAHPDDAGEVSAMHVRCTPATVFARYHDLPPMTGRFLSRLLDSPIALVAVAANGSVVALATLTRESSDPIRQSAVIVEDRWQGVGLGGALTDHLAAMARLVGFREDDGAPAIPGELPMTA